MLSGGEAARRNWYLANLGVVRYVPRDELSSDQALAGDDDLRESDPQPAATAAAAPAMSAANVPSQRQERVRPRVDLGDTQPVVSAPPAVRVRESEAVADIFQCRIGFWQPAAKVVVLSAMPPGQRPTPVQVTMLANLLKAIGAFGEVRPGEMLPGEALPGVDLIDWPPSSGHGRHGGATLAAAREYLGVFLQAKRQLQSFDSVLLMGEIAARACGDDEAFEVGRQLELSSGVRGIVTHSLHDMDKTPALKGETWQAIRFLAG